MIRFTFLHVFGLLTIASGGLLVEMTPESASAQNALQNWPENTAYKKVPRNSRLSPPSIVILRNGQFDDNYSAANLDAFLKDRFFPELINHTSRFPEKGSVRYDPVGQIRGYLNTQSAAPEVHQALVQISLEQSKMIANDAQIYPPSRVEAVMIMAELNSPDATKQLLAIVIDPTKFDGLRVAALTGITQQASQGWITDPGVSGNVIAMMGKLAKAPVPEGPKADARRWMRGQAAEILGLLKWPGQTNEVPDALLKMVVDERKDPKMPSLTLHQRCQAARALSQLNYGNGFDAQKCIAGLTLLAHDIRTSPHANDRRFLRARLGDVVAALDKLSTIASGAAKDQADKVKGSLQADCDSFDTGKQDKDTLNSMNERSLKVIDKFITK